MKLFTLPKSGTLVEGGDEFGNGNYIILLLNANSFFSNILILNVQETGNETGCI